MGSKVVRLEDVRDARISAGLAAAGRDVGAKLDKVRCPTHKKAPWNVRVHFDARGAADLKYESCCEALGAAVGKALG
jgi:hypothetical protein